jgi:polyhydroxyalkanoate synthesis regulator phasin
MTTSRTADWQAWIDGRIRASQKASEKALIGAVADVLGDERADRQKEIAALRETVETLRLEVAELRGATARGEPPKAGKLSVIG